MAPHYVGGLGVSALRYHYLIISAGFSANVNISNPRYLRGNLGESRTSTNLSRGVVALVCRQNLLIKRRGCHGPLHLKGVPRQWGLMMDGGLHETDFHGIVTIPDRGVVAGRDRVLLGRTPVAPVAELFRSV